MKSAFSDELISNSHSDPELKISALIQKTVVSERDYYKELFVSWFGSKRLSILKHYWQPIHFDENDDITSKEY